MNSDSLREELAKAVTRNQAGYYELFEAAKYEVTPDASIDIDAIDHIMQLFTQHTEQQKREATSEAYSLLFWMYKELNGQSVDKKFIEAYNILNDKLQAPHQPKEEI